MRKTDFLRSGYPQGLFETNEQLPLDAAVSHSCRLLMLPPACLANLPRLTPSNAPRNAAALPRGDACPLRVVDMGPTVEEATAFAVNPLPAAGHQYH